jgi:hypothetical protein
MENTNSIEEVKRELALAEEQRKLADARLAQLQNSLLDKYVEKYSQLIGENIREKYQKANETEKVKILEVLQKSLEHNLQGRLETSVLDYQEEPREVIYLDCARSLSELIYKAATYKLRELGTVEKLANWMGRSVPTAYRIIKDLEQIKNGDLPLEELNKIDLRSTKRV